jgi:hypothetical protein
MGRPLKPPLYVLPHGIEVIGEYAPTAKNPYWRARIRPHRFFPGVPVIGGGLHVRRSRVVLAAKLGRALTAQEHAHHDDEDRTHDTLGNLLLLSAAEHNRHHKTGSKHTAEAKNRISRSLRLAIAEGRRSPPPRPDWTGKTHNQVSRERISSSRKERIASGQIAKPVPPSTKGRPMPESAKERIRAAKLAYWQQRKEATA